MALILPLQIVYRGLPFSEALDLAVRRRVSHLSQFCDNIMSCRVVVQLIDRHRHQGHQYGVHIDLKIAGHELVARRVKHEDVYVAVRDAFDDLRRQLEDAVRRRRSHLLSPEQRQQRRP